MGWKDAIKYAKGAIAKHQEPAAPAADAGLPLGARIGGLVNLQANTFIRAMTQGSLMNMVDGKNNMIQAISRVRLNLDGMLYRYYLSKGDDGVEPERFLQVFKNARGDISEIMYCTTLTRIIPQSLEDQKAYTGEDGYGLGQKTFSLARADLLGLGMTEEQLQAAVGDADAIEYWRDIGDREAEFVTPLSGVETRIDDAFGDKGLEQDVVFMPYVRDIGDMREYLLISTEVVHSVDGDASKREIHVDMMLGLPLDLSRVTIQ